MLNEVDIGSRHSFDLLYKLYCLHLLCCSDQFLRIAAELNMQRAMPRLHSSFVPTFSRVGKWLVQPVLHQRKQTNKSTKKQNTTTKKKLKRKPHKKLKQKTVNDLAEYLKIIPRARMGSESIAHEAEGRMGYWLRGHNIVNRPLVGF